MLLTKSKRNTYLKELGFKSIKDLQKKYFIRKQDIDGKYGTNTDILLRNAYAVHTNCKNFTLEEFRCKCKGKYCTQYPAVIDTNLLKYLQDIRDKYGSMNINSGLRCIKHNEACGGIKNSKHTKGKGVDFTNKKICASSKTMKAFIDEYIKKGNSNYAYTNGYGRTKTKTTKPSANGMKGIIHIDTK